MSAIGCLSRLGVYFGVNPFYGLHRASAAIRCGMLSLPTDPARRRAVQKAFRFLLAVVMAVLGLLGLWVLLGAV
jgi:hypothetical protein